MIHSAFCNTFVISSRRDKGERNKKCFYKHSVPFVVASGKCHTNEIIPCIIVDILHLSLRIKKTVIVILVYHQCPAN